MLPRFPLLSRVSLPARLPLRPLRPSLPARLPSLAALALTALALGLAACGGDDEPSAPGGPEATAELDGAEQSAVAGDADPEAVEVIEGWSEALAAGDLDAAAAFFALPSVAENGPTSIQIRELADARLFNGTLPCGAVLVRAETEGDFTTATFRLTERPGPGVCGPGVDGMAQTAFVIEDGKIAEWRRVAAGGDRAPTQSS